MGGRVIIDRDDAERLSRVQGRVLALVLPRRGRRETFVTYFQNAFLLGGRVVGTPAQRCFERALKVAVDVAVPFTDAEAVLRKML